MAGYSFSQAYIPMPSDSGATWRYRIYDVDYITHILDFIVFLNGRDTETNGYIYHQLISRSADYVVPNGTAPPIIAITATQPDLYYGGMRESDKKVYFFNGTTESLLFDFNATTGSYIPSYSGTDQVVAIDYVLLAGVYHKRYLTTDTGYSVIEGVGSSRGLIPQLDDGGPDISFYCFSYDSVTYGPIAAVPCTYVYPIGTAEGIPFMVSANDITIYPVPASGAVHIAIAGYEGVHQAAIYNYLGQLVWSGSFNGKLNVNTSSWAAGAYYFRLFDAYNTNITGTFIIE